MTKLPGIDREAAEWEAISELRLAGAIGRFETALVVGPIALIFVADMVLYGWWLVDRVSFVSVLAVWRDELRPLWQAIPGRREMMLTARLEDHPDTAHLVGALYLANAIVLVVAFVPLTTLAFAIFRRLRRSEHLAALAEPLRSLARSGVAFLLLIVGFHLIYQWSDGPFLGAEFTCIYVLLASAYGAFLPFCWLFFVIVALQLGVRIVQFVRETT